MNPIHLNYSLPKAALLALVSLIFIASAFTSSATAQRRDFMNDQEIELVRDNQDIDLRMNVLTMMIDRRFSSIGIDAGGWKPGQKDSAKWGEAPKGTRLELLTDIKKLLQKAVDDIDDVAMHNENTLTQNKKEGMLFPKAVRALSTAAARYEVALKLAIDKTTDEKEKGPILDSQEFCRQIIEASSKLPPEIKK